MMRTEDLVRRLLRDLPDVLAHSFRIADRVSNGDRSVALLHDVLEDTCTTFDELRNAVGSAVADSVLVLTRRLDETYAEYVDRVADSGDAVAVRVKVADLRDHLDLAETLRESLRGRYERALAVLER